MNVSIDGIERCSQRNLKYQLLGTEILGNCVVRVQNIYYILSNMEANIRWLPKQDIVLTTVLGNE